MIRKRFAPWAISVCATLFLALLIAPQAWADDVTPSDRVETHVIIRDAPGQDGGRIGILEPGQTLTLIGDVPRWYRVRLPDGREGYVSKAWTDVIDTAEPTLPIVAERAPVRMHIIDVGTGLAIYLEGPGFALIYDGGSNDDDALGANNRLLAYLREVSPNLRRIDHVILSHPHADHVALLPDLFDRYEIGNVWDSGRLNDICGYRELLERVAARPFDPSTGSGTQYHTTIIENGMHRVRFARKKCRSVQLSARTVEIANPSMITTLMPIALGPGVSMVFLYANGQGSASSDPNRNSLVVRLDIGQRRILLTGDAEAGDRRAPQANVSPSSIEGRLLMCCLGELRTDVLVVGHHGSETSSRTAFLNAVAAQTFIISSGPHRYRGVQLPDATIVTELEQRGTVLRTDVDDDDCAQDSTKIGNDADGLPGGCTNIVVTIDGSTLSAGYANPSD